MDKCLARYRFLVALGQLDEANEDKHRNVVNTLHLRQRCTAAMVGAGMGVFGLGAPGVMEWGLHLTF